MYINDIILIIVNEIVIILWCNGFEVIKSLNIFFSNDANK